MVTGEFKNRIDGLWDVFATSWLTNPLEVIEQITYLMFIHDLEILFLTNMTNTTSLC